MKINFSSLNKKNSQTSSTNIENVFDLHSGNAKPIEKSQQPDKLFWESSNKSFIDGDTLSTSIDLHELNKSNFKPQNKTPSKRLFNGASYHNLDEKKPSQKQIHVFKYSEEKRPEDYGRQSRLQESVVEPIFKAINSSPKKNSHLQSFEQTVSALNIQCFPQYNKATNKSNQNHSAESNHSPSKKTLKQISQITQRLNATHQKCGRKSCQKIISSSLQKQMADIKEMSNNHLNLNLESPHSHNPLKNSIISAITIDEKTMSKSLTVPYKQQLHEKLYNQSLLKEFREVDAKRQNLKLLTQTFKARLPGKSKNREYNKDLPDFYQRLDDSIDQKQQKRQLYESLNLSFQGERLFEPSIEKSKKSHKLGAVSYFKPILSKNRDKPIKRVLMSERQHTIDNQKFSDDQLGNKVSMEIVENRQRQFLSKIKKLVFDRSKKKVEVDSQAIAEFSQKEFKIFFPLLIDLERRGSKIKGQKQLEKVIKNFYNVPFCLLSSYVVLRHSRQAGTQAL